MTDIRKTQLNNRLERFIDMLWPLLVIAVTLTLYGKGFPSFRPAIACTVFSLMQPLTRGFLFDTLRPSFVQTDQLRLFYVLEAVFYTAASVFIAKQFV